MFVSMLVSRETDPYSKRENIKMTPYSSCIVAFNNMNSELVCRVTNFRSFLLSIDIVLLNPYINTPYIHIL